MKRITLNRVGSIDLEGGCHYVNFHKGLNVITGDRETGKSTILEVIDYCFGKSNNESIPKTITSITLWHFVVCQLGDSTFLLARHATSKTKFILTNIEKDEKNFNDIIKQANIIDWSETNRLLFQKHNIEVETLVDYATNKERKITFRNCLSFCLQKGEDILSKKVLLYRMDNENKKRSLVLELPLLFGFIDFAFYKRLDELYSCRREVDRLSDRIRNYNQDKELEKIYNMIKALFIETNNENNLDFVKDKESFLQYRVNLDDFDPYESNAIDSIKVIKNNMREYEKYISNLEYKLFQIQQQYNSFNDLSKKLNSIQEKSMIIEDIIDDFEVSDVLKDRFFEMRNYLNKELSKININKNMNLEYEKNKVLKELKSIKNKRIEASNLLNKIEQQYIQDISFKEKLKKLYKLEAMIEESFDNYNGVLLNMRNMLIKYENYLTKLEAKHKAEKEFKDQAMSEFENKVSIYINEDIKDLYPMFEHKSKEIGFDLNKLECYYENNNNERVYLSGWGSDNNVLFSHVAVLLAFQRSLVDTKSCVPSFIAFDQLSRGYFPDNVVITESMDMKSLNMIIKVIIKVIDEVKSNSDNELQVILIEHANGGMSRDFLNSKIRNDKGDLITFTNGIKYINESIYKTNVFNEEKKLKRK